VSDAPSEAPNPKLQIPNNNQIPKTKIPKRAATVPFEIWNLKVPWDLGFGIWDFRLCIAQYVSVRVKIPE
jgi:hypothetical protein